MVHADGDVTLKDIAACCENYTGADIKALLVNAQLEAVHAEMNKSANYTGKSCPTLLTILVRVVPLCQLY